MNLVGFLFIGFVGCSLGIERVSFLQSLDSFVKSVLCNRFGNYPEVEDTVPVVEVLVVV